MTEFIEISFTVRITNEDELLDIMKYIVNNWSKSIKCEVKT